MHTSLPIVPFPKTGEALSSWLARVGARYDLRADHILRYAGHTRYSARELDWRICHSADQALESVTEMGQRSLLQMRCGTRGRLWGRDHHVWCRSCLQEDLEEFGEPWERKTWRTGASIICFRHKRLLEDICPRCLKTGEGCLFVCENGRLRGLCALKADKVLLWIREPKSQLPWSLVLNRNFLHRVNVLTRDLNRILHGNSPHSLWRGVSKTRSLMTVVEEFLWVVLMTLNAFPKPAPPLHWMLEHGNWQGEFHYTPAMLPINLAAGIMMLASILLAAPLSLRQSEKVSWNPNGRRDFSEDLTIENFSTWLHPAVKSWGTNLVSAPVGP